MVGGKCEMKNIDVVRAIIATVTELAPERAIKPAEELIRYVADRPGHDSNALKKGPIGGP